MSRNRHRVTPRLAALVAALGLLVTACGGGTTSQNDDGQNASASNTSETSSGTPADDPAPTGGTPSGELVVAIDRDADNLDPHQSRSSTDRHLLYNIFDRLVHTAPDLTLEPGLATEWSVSDDGLTWTFALREGVVFHDGTEFTADVVAYNIDRMRSVTKNERIDEIALIDQVNVVDDHTVEFVLSEPFSGLPVTFSDRAGMMVSPTAADELGEDGFPQAPVGTGPFAYDSRVAGDSVTLVANPDYWGEIGPAAERVVFKALPDTNVKMVQMLSGQLDVVDTVTPQVVPELENNDNITVSTVQGPYNIRVFFQTTSGPFADPALRRALDASIDRAQVTEVSMGDLAAPAPSPFPNFGQFADLGLEVPSRDLARAQRELEAAGQPDGFAFTLNHYADDPIQAQMAAAIQAQAAEAGIEVTIVPVEFGTLLAEMREGNYEATLLTNSGVPDLLESVYRNFHSQGGGRYENYATDAMDALLEDLRSTTDPQREQELLGELVDLFHQDVPQITLWHRKDVKAFTDEVTGFAHYADGVYRLAGVSAA